MPRTGAAAVTTTAYFHKLRRPRTPGDSCWSIGPAPRPKLARTADKRRRCRRVDSARTYTEIPVRAGIEKLPPPEGEGEREWGWERVSEWVGERDERDSESIREKRKNNSRNDRWKIRKTKNKNKYPNTHGNVRTHSSFLFIYSKWPRIKQLIIHTYKYIARVHVYSYLPIFKLYVPPTRRTEKYTTHIILIFPSE